MAILTGLHSVSFLPNPFMVLPGPLWILFDTMSQINTPFMEFYLPIGTNSKSHMMNHYFLGLLFEAYRFDCV